jgi:hypothetical protein
MEKVQAVRLLLYVRQQHTTRFSDLHHASVDVDLVANLIELTDAHDVGSQTRDEVNPVEGPGLTILAHKHDSPVAPVSRTHVPTSRSFSSSRWVNTFSSWISTSALDEITSG